MTRGVTHEAGTWGRRRGGVYIAVLGLSSLMAVVTLSGMAATRLTVRRTRAEADMAEARSYALAAIELGRLAASKDANWRSSKGDGAWMTNVNFGAGTLSLEAEDPADDEIGNRPHDPVVLRGTGTCGSAVQIVEATLMPQPTTLPVLASAVHGAGGLTVYSGQTLDLRGGTASAGATITTSAATLNGNARALLVVNLLGNITGSTTILAGAPALPPASTVSMYAAMGTAIGTTLIDRQALSPGRNPWGAPNPDGVYVITTGSNVTIRRSRIHGTLVVIAPGKTVTFDDQVFIEPARPDYPAVIVDGHVSFGLDSTMTLSEATEGTNFNPTGAPYAGITDSDTTDTYPSEVRGLVHATGAVALLETTRIRGSVISAFGGIPAVMVNGTPQVIHDPALLTTPPQGYTESVGLTVVPGSWKQIVR